MSYGVTNLELLQTPTPTLEQLAVRVNGPIAEGPPDLIPGLLPKAGQLVIAGETNIGKSLFALEVCSSLATGQPLWGELQPVETAKRILYVLGEHHVGVIQRLAAHTQLAFPDHVFLLGPEHLYTDKQLVINGKLNTMAMAKFKQWAKGCDLIVFDPLAAFVAGTDAENDNVQMRMVLDAMSLICQTADASCLVLAHQGKPMMDKFGKEHKRKSYAIRGASAIEDAATNIFYFGKADGESDAAQKVADGQIYELSCRKYKGEAPPVYRLLRDKATLTHKLLGNRPFSEVQQMVIQASAAKVQNAFPNMTFADVLKAVAVMHDCSESTVRRCFDK